ncbi:MAG: 2-phosphosulfolactate phosphatase [Verrucomicrobiota bacterium]
MKIDVALEPSEIAQLGGRDLTGTTCVVFDVLRATSSMVTGLSGGVEEIIPVSTIEEALAKKGSRSDLLLGGERFGERIQGFDLGNSPFEYRDLRGAKIVTTTTNGTVALRACVGAQRVFVGAILNLGAVVRMLKQSGVQSLLLVCAGTFETLALEDVWAAGCLLRSFQDEMWSDAAHVAFGVVQRWPEPLAALKAARNGRELLSKGRLDDVEWCAKESVLDVVGVMEEGVVRPVFGA